MRYRYDSSYVANDNVLYHTQIWVAGKRLSTQFRRSRSPLSGWRTL
jgi:hypothetical protein